VPIAPSLLVFALLYGGLDSIGGVLGAKLVAFGPFAVEGGMFSFLVLVVLGSATAELHGRAVAERLVRWGFVPLTVSLLLTRGIIALPPAPFWHGQAAFAAILGQSTRMMAAGMIAYLVSQTLNVRIFARLRGQGRGGGGRLWLRAFVAGAISQLVDTGLFITLSFWGVAPIGRILAGQALAKLVLSSIAVPPLVHLLVAIGRRLDSRG
jgi:uncharacterized integral membrane protein (TIGR00697 family)